MMKIELWRAGILTFHAAGSYENPFLDLSIWGEFTGPSGRVIRREAYWDGGDTYRISFAPTETGVWQYRLSAPKESGLDGASGQVEGIPYSGTLDIYKHGFLRVSENKRYLTYADGTPFFWLGDTHWGFIDGERLNESNYEKTDSMFRYMIEKRAAQRFTIYQTNLHADGNHPEAHFWVDGQEGLLPDVAFYQREVDIKMQYLADAGLVNALGFSWANSCLDKAEQYKNLARYMVARYGALPMVWTLAGESSGYAPHLRQITNDTWREVALLVEELDGYGSLQTTHYTNDRPYAEYYADEDWFDFTLNQAGHGDMPLSIVYMKEHRKKHPNKPFVEGESLYEGCSPCEPNGARPVTPRMLRRMAYLSMQLGGAGYTYGAQGIWDCMWEKPEQPDPFNRFNQYGIPWYEAIEAPGADCMTYMREFYEAMKWYEMIPSNGLRVELGMYSDPLFAGVVDPQVLATPDRTRICAYYPETIFAPIAMCGLSAPAYQAEWFDPSTGKYHLVGKIVPEDGSWDGLRRPDGGDWMLVLRAIGEE